MDINEKISEILKKHVEGKEFFDALDYMIRSDADVLKIFMNFLKSDFERNSLNKRVGIILTGEFGHALYNNYRHDLLDMSRDIIFVSGGLRKPNTCVELYTDALPCEYYVVLDDSIYSGNTIKNIGNALNINNTYTQSKLYMVYVIYDGSKDIKFNELYGSDVFPVPNTNIKSLFKYHK